MRNTEKNSMDWDRELWPGMFSEPDWLIEPDVSVIPSLIQPYIPTQSPNRLSSPSDVDARSRPYRQTPPLENIAVEAYKSGAYNKTYLVTVKADDFHTETSQHPQVYILRVTIPVDLWYKLESEISTMSYVREHTSIPVPLVYAYDTSCDNTLGFEWMLMEFIPGRKLSSRVRDDSMTLSQQKECIVTVAGWLYQLSRLRFDAVGSIFYDWDTGRYTIGRAEDIVFVRDQCVKYSGADISRGPFRCFRDYFQAIVNITRAYYTDPVNIEAAEELQRLIDAGDRKAYNAAWWRPDQLTGWLPSHCTAVEKVLAALFPKNCDRGNKEMETQLYHHDAHGGNIIVDEEGRPTALIDWENVMARPVEMIDPEPKVLYMTLVEWGHKSHEDVDEEHEED
ncbi:kinase-like domain-containing protein [Amylocarpus encephaloides]|uniref:Kinase-like domain-containing protein n=1 Tax=Amylocarpus encephaloides TaxID=45428 RepID=A0A9P7YQ88_9HELO|nr:kinase-like domain-containing protein [Amylocarpus encephaloides]